MKEIPRAMKGEMRQRIAAELRGRIAESPPADATPELRDAWPRYCREIAYQIAEPRVDRK